MQSLAGFVTPLSGGLKLPVLVNFPVGDATHPCKVSLTSDNNIVDAFTIHWANVPTNPSLRLGIDGGAAGVVLCCNYFDTSIPTALDAGGLHIRNTGCVSWSATGSAYGESHDATITHTGTQAANTSTIIVAGREDLALPAHLKLYSDSQDVVGQWAFGIYHTAQPNNACIAMGTSGGLLGQIGFGTIFDSERPASRCYVNSNGLGMKQQGSVNWSLTDYADGETANVSLKHPDTHVLQVTSDFGEKGVLLALSPRTDGAPTMPTGCAGLINRGGDLYAVNAAGVETKISA